MITMKIKSENKRIGKKDIVILIPPWNMPQQFFYLIEKKIPENFGYISYYYSEEILNSDPYLTEKYFLKFINRIISDLKALNKTKPRAFYIYGQSLGALFGMIVADKIYINKLVLIAPGDNLAECFWNGNKTQHLRRLMEKNSVTLTKLKNFWRKISPDYYFKNKAVKSKYYVQIAKKDHVIPYKNGIKLIKLFKQKNIIFKLEEDNISHEFKLILEAISSRKAIRFFLD